MTNNTIYPSRKSRHDLRVPQKRSSQQLLANLYCARPLLLYDVFCAAVTKRLLTCTLPQGVRVRRRFLRG